jgi:hypothetical protein
VVLSWGGEAEGAILNVGSKLKTLD